MTQRENERVNPPPTPPSSVRKYGAHVRSPRHAAPALRRSSCRSLPLCLRSTKGPSVLTGFPARPPYYGPICHPGPFVPVLPRGLPFPPLGPFATGVPTPGFPHPDGPEDRELPEVAMKAPHTCSPHTQPHRSLRTASPISQRVALPRGCWLSVRFPRACVLVGRACGFGVSPDTLPSTTVRFVARTGFGPHGCSARAKVDLKWRK